MMHPASIVDAHVHLWDPEQLRLLWLDNNPVLNRAHILERHTEQTNEAPIDLYGI